MHRLPIQRLPTQRPPTQPLPTQRPPTQPLPTQPSVYPELTLPLEFEEDVKRYKNYPSYDIAYPLNRPEIKTSRGELLVHSSAGPDEPQRWLSFAGLCLNFPELRVLVLDMEHIVGLDHRPVKRPDGSLFEVHAPSELILLNLDAGRWLTDENGSENRLLADAVLPPQLLMYPQLKVFRTINCSFRIPDPEEFKATNASFKSNLEEITLFNTIDPYDQGLCFERFMDFPHLIILRLIGTSFQRIAPEMGTQCPNLLKLVLQRNQHDTPNMQGSYGRGGRYNIIHNAGSDTDPFWPNLMHLEIANCSFQVADPRAFERLVYSFKELETLIIEDSYNHVYSMYEREIEADKDYFGYFNLGQSERSGRYLRPSFDLGRISRDLPLLRTLSLSHCSLYGTLDHVNLVYLILDGIFPESGDDQKGECVFANMPSLQSLQFRYNRESMPIRTVMRRIVPEGKAAKRVKLETKTYIVFPKGLFDSQYVRDVPYLSVDIDWKPNGADFVHCERPDIRNQFLGVDITHFRRSDGSWKSSYEHLQQFANRQEPLITYRTERRLPNLYFPPVITELSPCNELLAFLRSIDVAKFNRMPECVLNTIVGYVVRVDWQTKPNLLNRESESLERFKSRLDLSTSGDLDELDELSEEMEAKFFFKVNVGYNKDDWYVYPVYATEDSKEA